MKTDSDRLRLTLTGFADAICSAPNPREGVSVRLARKSGFQNVATTGSRDILLDEPTHFGGSGQAPDPAEYLLAAIGASLSVTLTAHAALRNIALDHIEMALSADIDGRSFFEPGGGHPAGLLDMTIALEIVSPEPARAVRRLVRDALKAVPVLRSLKRLPKVKLTLRQS